MKIEVLDHGFVRLLNIAGPMSQGVADTDPARCARMSFAAFEEEGRTREDDLKLVKYLMTHGHNMPIEMIEVWIEMKLPIFVARQFVRHRTVSINEVSARYVQLPDEFYIPEPENVGRRPPKMKQGRIVDGASGPVQISFVEEIREHCRTVYRLYQNSLADGIPPEVARMILPLNIYTHWLWKQDLHNMLHFLKLRADAHAQWEAQQYALAVKELLRRELPEIIAMWEKIR